MTSSGDKDLALKKSEQSKINPRNEIEFECLLHPGLQIGGPIYVDARKNERDHKSVLGKFYVTELNYSGDNFGRSYNVSGKAVEK